MKNLFRDGIEASEFQLTLAEQLLTSRELDRALDCFDLAQELGADADRCAAGRWMVYMLRGSFPGAWRESDAIRRRANPDPNRFWQGEELAGKRVIVRCLHGLGDTVQFFRYAPRLNEAAAKVIWEVPPAMLELAPHVRGVDEVVTWGDNPEWDVQMEVMELPYFLRTDIAELPLATEYIELPGSLVRSVAAQMGPHTRPRIGVVWGAGEWNVERSIPLVLLGRLFEGGRCEFWNLQGGAIRDGWRELPHRVRLRRIEACESGVLSLAAVIAGLDLVLTVDTLAAHLAGALGVPAWVMLQHGADWRWMVERADSPWYPSLRLIRQPSPGDWKSVVSSVDSALEEWVGSAAWRQTA